MTQRDAMRGELRASAVCGDHQGPVRIVGPMFVAGEDFKSQDALVPNRGLMPIRDEELDVVDLGDSHSPSGDSCDEKRTPFNPNFFRVILSRVVTLFTNKGMTLSRSPIPSLRKVPIEFGLVPVLFT